jgi:hypothetical protein
MVFEKIDKPLEGIEDTFKLPRGVTSRQLVPEIIARILEIPVELVATDVTGAKIAEFIIGAALMGTPGFIGPALSREWSARDTEDIYAIGKQWLIEATDPSVDDLVKVANAIQNLRLGISFGDPRRISSAFGVKSWQQIQADWANVANAFGAAFGMPGARAPAKPATQTAPGATTPPLYKETLSGGSAAGPKPAAPSTPTPIPGVNVMYRSTVGDHMQPSLPAVTPRFRLTLGAKQ